ncbi:forkhead box protein S1 [Platysternon megacephalum]|uniref:Forkhead box protein S1 n=1 Tax=Platysternon megacephalum TaxID=55544 RepID=A0A4D9DZ21_9SAUR|nr:forkhead box protein S1 [Platysternon megacephalum]
MPRPCVRVITTLAVLTAGSLSNNSMDVTSSSLSPASGCLQHFRNAMIHWVTEHITFAAAGQTYHQSRQTLCHGGLPSHSRYSSWYTPSPGSAQDRQCSLERQATPVPLI